MLRSELTLNVLINRYVLRRRYMFKYFYAKNIMLMVFFFIEVYEPIFNLFITYLIINTQLYTTKLVISISRYTCIYIMHLDISKHSIIKCIVYVFENLDKSIIKTRRFDLSLNKLKQQI